MKISRGRGGIRLGEYGDFSDADGLQYRRAGFMMMLGAGWPQRGTALVLGAGGAGRTRPPC
ncbi:MAG: hypothetical protein ACLRSW_16535 [Christensenellaceae bacterium]